MAVKQINLNGELLFNVGIEKNAVVNTVCSLIVYTLIKQS